MKDLISIIVPCYNEEESLRLFHEAVKKTEAKLPDYSFEILLVNDGSKDRTLEVMRELAQQDPEVSYFSFSRNFGKEAAMYAGFCHARGKYGQTREQGGRTSRPELVCPAFLQPDQQHFRG